jgi:hypothetical protein
MKINVDAVYLEGALHGLNELSAEHLIVHSEQTLVAVRWPELRQIRDAGRVVLGPQAHGNIIATGVCVDDAWIVDRKSYRVLIAKESAIESIDPAGLESVRHIPIPGLVEGTFAASLDSEGRNLLLVLMRVVNMDFAEYGVAVADLANNRLLNESTIRSNHELEVLWDRILGTWVIGNTVSATVWRWQADGVAVKLAGTVAVPVHFASFVETNQGVIVNALATQNGTSVVVTGRAERDRIVWAEPVPLVGSTVLVARRHPTQPFWACLAQQETEQYIQVRSAEGKILAEASVRTGAHLSDVIWSASSPHRIWGFGTRSLAAATVQQ